MVVLCERVGVGRVCVFGWVFVGGGHVVCFALGAKPHTTFILPCLFLSPCSNCPCCDVLCCDVLCAASTHTHRVGDFMYVDPSIFDFEAAAASSSDEGEDAEKEEEEAEESDKDDDKVREGGRGKDWR